MSYAYLFKYIIIGDTGKYLFLLPYLDTAKIDKNRFSNIIERKFYQMKLLTENNLGVGKSCLLL